MGGGQHGQVASQRGDRLLKRAAPVRPAVKGVENRRSLGDEQVVALELAGRRLLPGADGKRPSLSAFAWN
ncbi:MAG: hypothetical protein HQ582_25245 [Planctomycetes bacterium]|nr:hypothetical protein [Planctomycetota bacterium]